MIADIRRDIFIAYAHKDLDKVKILVKALEAQKWSVWWDREIPTGVKWEEYIYSVIYSCKSVIVIWSKNSVISEQVNREATLGMKLNKLIPVITDNSSIPSGFEIIQAAQVNRLQDLEEITELLEHSDNALPFSKLLLKEAEKTAFEHSVQEFNKFLDATSRMLQRPRLKEQEQLERIRQIDKTKKEYTRDLVLIGAFNGFKRGFFMVSILIVAIQIIQGTIFKDFWATIISALKYGVLGGVLGLAIGIIYSWYESKI